MSDTMINIGDSGPPKQAKNKEQFPLEDVNDGKGYQMELLEAFEKNDLEQFKKILTSKVPKFIKIDELGDASEMESTLYEVILSTPLRMLEEKINKLLTHDLDNKINSQGTTRMEFILKFLVSLPFYNNLKIFIEANKTSSKNIVADNIKALFKENFENFSPTEMASKEKQENLLKFTLEYSNDQTPKHLTNLKEHSDSSFIKLVIAIHKNENDKVINIKINDYKKDIDESTWKHKDNESLKHIFTCDVSVLIDYAMQRNIKNLNPVIKNLLEIEPLDINEVRLSHKKNLGLAFYAAEKGKHTIMEYCLEKDGINMINQITKESQDNADKDKHKYSSIFSTCLFGEDYHRQNAKHSEKEFKRDCTDEFSKCIKTIIGKMDDTKLDRIDPMYFAMKYRNDYAKKNLLDKFGIREEFLDEMDEKSIEMYLNSCIKEEDSTKDDCISQRISVNYGFLTKTGNDSMEILRNLTKNEPQKNLICHPIIALYINENSKNYNIFYLINFVVYCILFVVPAIVEYANLLPYALALPFLYLIFRESFQLIKMWRVSRVSLTRALKEHFSSHTNQLEFALIVFTLLTFGFSTFTDRNRFRYKLSFITLILLGTLEFTILFTETFEKQSKYMLMLYKVVATFIGAFLIVCLFNVSFAFCFHLLIISKNDISEDLNKFESFSTSMLKMAAMFNGEYEASKYGYCNDKNSYFFGLFFIVFILSIIILSNFVNALAISDVQELCDSAEFQDLKLRIIRIRKMQKILKNSNCIKYIWNIELKPLTEVIIESMKDGYKIQYIYGEVKKSSITFDNDMYYKIRKVMEEYNVDMIEAEQDRQIHNAIFSLTRNIKNEAGGFSRQSNSIGKGKKSKK